MFQRSRTLELEQDVSSRRAIGLRITTRIDRLARISERKDALTRVFLSPEHRVAAELLMSWMREAGMSARLDPAGNVIGRREGRVPGLPCLMLGSHYDTVCDAGRWDGPLGIITAIECVAELARRKTTLPFAIEVVGFSDEEGVRFASTLIGSRAMAGTFDLHLLEARDASGVTMREAMRRFGLPPEEIGNAKRSRDDLLGYCELHIEQGPVLEKAALPVGVVTAISGANRFSVEVIGKAGHAGTVPMMLRTDALTAAAACILEVESLCREDPEVVGTVGSILAQPGAGNVIPGLVRFSMDLRAADDDKRRHVAAAVIAAIDRIGAERRITMCVTQTHENASVPVAGWLRDQLAEAITAEGYPLVALPSGAGHDAMAMIDVTDIAMVFVRCKDGISHHPLESVTVEDAAAGAQVLLRFIEHFQPRSDESAHA